MVMERVTKYSLDVAQGQYYGVTNEAQTHYSVITELASSFFISVKTE